MRRGLRLLWVLACVWMVGGAQAQDNPALPHRAVRDNLLTIAWMPKSLDNPIYELGYQGCVQAAEELSARGKLKVECVYAGSNHAESTAQQLAIADMITRKIDSIAVSCVEAVACVGPINAAMNAGIPVMTWESDSPQSMRLTHLGIDDYQAGRAAATLLVRAMGTSGDVAVLAGNQASYNMEERLRGFNEVISLYPRIEIVETLASEENIARSISQVEDVMSDNPRLDGWFFAGMWPFFGGIDTLPQFEAGVRHSNMRAVGFEALPATLQAMQDGYLHGLISQNYWDWGYRSVYMMYDHIVNKSTLPPSVGMDTDIVTIANVDTMVAAWENYDFSRPLPPAFPPEDNAFRLAWIPKQLNNPVFELGRDACGQAANEISTRYNIDAQCLYMGTGAADMDAQARIIADAVAQDVDAIAVSCNSDIGCVEPINAAIEAGIPVMTWDSDSPESRRLTYLGVNNYEAGRAAGEQLVNLMGDAGEVIVLSGSAAAANLNDRVRGFSDYVAQYPNITIVEVLYSNDDSALAARLLEAALSASPNVDGVFLAGLWPILAGREALPQFVAAAEQNTLRVVAFDTLPVELEWLQAGVIDALIGQKYWGWGYDSMYMMFNHVTNAEYYPFIMDSGFDVVTQANVAVMMDFWQQRDFAQPLQPDSR